MNRDYGITLCHDCSVLVCAPGVEPDVPLSHVDETFDLRMSSDFITNLDRCRKDAGLILATGGEPCCLRNFFSQNCRNENADKSIVNHAVAGDFCNGGDQFP